MAGASAEGEQNPWPAFVDVLTTVIMVVTFLLVIMSAAVMKLSQSVVEEVKQIYNSGSIDKLQSELQQARKDLESERTKRHTLEMGMQIGENGRTSSVALRAAPLTQAELSQGDLRRAVTSRPVDEDGRYAVDSPKDREVVSGTRVESADAVLTVTFEPDAVQLSNEVISQSVETIKRANLGPTAKYEIWSTAPIESSLSDAQRRAYFRALVVRNVLIRAGVSAQNISAQVRVRQTSNEQHAVRVIAKP
jgi:hypothetical protein